MRLEGSLNMLQRHQEQRISNKLQLKRHHLLLIQRRRKNQGRVKRLNKLASAVTAMKMWTTMMTMTTMMMMI